MGKKDIIDGHNCLWHIAYECLYAYPCALFELQSSLHSVFLDIFGLQKNC